MSFTPCPLVLVGLLEDHPRVEGGVGARRVVRGREREAGRGENQYVPLVKLHVHATGKQRL